VRISDLDFTDAQASSKMLSRSRNTQRGAVPSRNASTSYADGAATAVQHGLIVP